MTRKSILCIVILLVIGGAVFFLLRSRDRQAVVHENHVTDPAIGLSFDPGDAYVSLVHENSRRYFCSRKSVEAYLDNPDEPTEIALQGGWYSWPPYQYEDENLSVDGLDVVLIRRAFETRDIDVRFRQDNWRNIQDDIKYGLKDLAGGAFKTDERSEFAWFSEPYRNETNVLYVRGSAEQYPFTDIASMTAYFRESKFRLGTVRGYSYADSQLNKYIQQQSGTSLIVPGQTEKKNFENLFSGKIDGFFADRVVAATLIHENQWQGRVREFPHIQVSAGIHVLFSKNATSPALVQAFNTGLRELKQSGEYSRIVRKYTFPVLIAQTTQKGWFFHVDILGTIAFAISGLLLARKGRYDIFGAFVLGALPAVGGGIMRDIFVNRRPAGVLRTPYYIYAILITVIVGFILAHSYSYLEGWLRRDNTLVRRKTMKHFNMVVEVFDALGLALFTVIGVVITIECRCEPLWIWGPILAAITSSGGGILRDIVLRKSEISSLKGSFYPVVSLIWGFLLSVFMMFQTTRLNPDEIFLAVVITIAGAFTTRMLALRFHWKTPSF